MQEVFWVREAQVLPGTGCMGIFRIPMQPVHSANTPLWKTILLINSLHSSKGSVRVTSEREVLWGNQINLSRHEFADQVMIYWVNNYDISRNNHFPLAIFYYVG